ncbi:LysM peptidoglycan-binding domain-containing protein [Rubricoccus marinus]|nr:LysM peptidoglycan-binding domain-containing protein [Rubricoccus marinus]
MIRLLLFAALFLAASGVAPEAAAQDSRVHVVQPGETLYRIATDAGMSVAELKAFNSLDSDTIRVGQRLRLPARGAAQTPRQPEPRQPEPRQPEAPVTPRPEPRVEAPRVPTGRPTQAPAASGGTTHTVVAGESLFRIALRYDTTVEALRQLNNIQGDQIEVGQRLVVTRGGGRPSTGGATQPAPIARARDWDIQRTTVPADMVHFTEPGETLYSIASSYGFSMDALIAQNAVTTAPLVPGTMLVLPRAVDPARAVRAELPPAMDAGLALVFPDVMQGRPTASGEAYDPLQFTASHRDLPFGTILLVTNPANGRSTFVRVADRGPVSQAYLMELSAAAASALDLDPNNARAVEIRALP